MTIIVKLLYSDGISRIKPNNRLFNKPEKCILYFVHALCGLILQSLRIQIMSFLNFQDYLLHESGNFIFDFCIYEVGLINIQHYGFLDKDVLFIFCATYWSSVLHEY